jgi:hypothetical protein
MNDPHFSQTLRHSLTEWTDDDIASYYVAVALGVAPDPGNEWSFWGGKKWMFWATNPLGDGLYHVLKMLAESGVLEWDEDGGKFRWNPNFDWERHGEKGTKI